MSASVGYLNLVRTNDSFRNLWIGQIISLLGDWFNLIASAALIASLTGSGIAVGGLFVVRMLAPFLISPFAGVAADRYNRKTILILCDLSRFFTVLGFFFVRSPEQVWLLYLLTFIQLAIGGIFFPTRNAILPDLVDSSGLGTANALSSTTWSVMLAIGAALGGIVSGTLGIYPAFGIDALTFLLSAVFIARITYGKKVAIHSSLKTVRQSFQEYLDGFRYLRKNSDIFVITLLKASLALTFSGIFSVVQVALAERVYPIGEGGSLSLGIIFTVFGVGTGLGPIFIRRFTRDRDFPTRLAIAGAYLLAIAGILLTAPLLNFSIVLAGTFLRGFAVGVNWVFSTQLLLSLLPDRVRGRVFATEFAIFTLATAASAAFGGWALDSTGLGLGGLMLLTAFLTSIPAVLWSLWMVMGRGQQRATFVSRSPRGEISEEID